MLCFVSPTPPSNTRFRTMGSLVSVHTQIYSAQVNYEYVFFKKAVIKKKKNDLPYIKNTFIFFFF